MCTMIIWMDMDGPFGGNVGSATSPGKAQDRFTRCIQTSQSISYKPNKPLQISIKIFETNYYN